MYTERSGVLDTFADSRGGEVGPGGREAAFNPLPHSVFSEPFLGWINLSELVVDFNPELSAAMRSMANVLRCALEVAMTRDRPTILSLLRESNIPSASLDELERSLQTGLLALSLEDATAEARDSLADAIRTEAIMETDPPEQGFLAAVVNYGGHALQGREVEQQLYWESPPHEVPDALVDFFSPPSDYRVAASLDLPSIVSGRGYSVECIRPIHSFKADNIEAEEHTYIDHGVTGLSNQEVRAAPLTYTYRDSIDEPLAEGFFESIDMGSPLDSFYFSFNLSDLRRSRAARKLQKLLQANQDSIRQIINAASDTATSLATGAAGAAGVPVGLFSPLLKPFPRMFGQALLEGLGRSMADSNMTPWTISHTTLYVPSLNIEPISLFVLLSPTALRARLHRMDRDPNDPDTSKMNLEYERKYRVYQRGRAMIGESQGPSQPCPADLWGQVSANNEPACWTEPNQDRAGFRVLVPHAEPGGDCSYVSALRADVLRV